MTESAAATGETREYNGLFGAFPYAFRRSDSRAFRLYVVVGGLVGLLLTVGFGLAFVVSIAQSTGLAAGGTSSFVRSFVLLVGFLVVLPVLAPVLLVARRHRRVGDDPRYDRVLAVAGFAYLVSIYLLAIASMPETFVLDGETVTRPPPSGLLAPVVSLLYAVPPVASPLIPATVAALGWLAHRRYR